MTIEQQPGSQPDARRQLDHIAALDGQRSAATTSSVSARPPGRSTVLPIRASNQCPGTSAARRAENGNGCSDGLVDGICRLEADSVVIQVRQPY